MGRYEIEAERIQELEPGITTSQLMQEMLRCVKPGHQVIALCVVTSDGRVHLPCAEEKRCFVDCMDALFAPVPGRKTGSELRILLSARQFAVDQRCERCGKKGCKGVEPGCLIPPRFAPPAVQ